MKVGITCYPTYGGSGIVATELGLELANRGHDVHFITYANPIRLDPGTPRIHYHEVEVSNYPLFQYPPYCLALASRMAEVAESYALDLLHVHYAIPHSIAALLAQQMLAPVRRLPFITTLHGTDITLVGSDRSYFPITKFSIEQSNGITSISEFIRERTADVFGVKNRVRVIPNFVNVATYKPDAQKSGARRFAPNGEKLLIHLSNFRPVKRVNDCIHILERVRKSAPAHLLMVGDGPDRGVLLMPSELEAFGLAALEAMACGVPPIGTNAGGVPELITNGVDGFMEAVGDIGAQAARAAELLTDDRLHERMAAAARHTAVTRFSTESIIPQYEQYYQEVCGGREATKPATSR